MVWSSNTAIHVSPCNLCVWWRQRLWCDGRVLVLSPRCVLLCMALLMMPHALRRSLVAVVVGGLLRVSSVGRSWCLTARQDVRESVVCGPALGDMDHPACACVVYDGAAAAGGGGGGSVLDCRGVDHSTDAQRGSIYGVVVEYGHTRIPVQLVCVVAPTPVV